MAIATGAPPGEARVAGRVKGAASEHPSETNGPRAASAPLTATKRGPSNRANMTPKSAVTARSRLGQSRMATEPRFPAHTAVSPASMGQVQ